MPSSSFTLEVKNIKKIITRFDAGDLVAQQLLTQGMQQAVDLTETNAGIYPPESEANQPPAPYYIRGVGTQYANGKNRNESKQLNQNWEKIVEIVNNGVIGRVTNRVIYGLYVHGRGFQMPWHAQRGWRTVNKIASDVRSSINNVFGVVRKRFTTYLKTGKVI